MIVKLTQQIFALGRFHFPNEVLLVPEILGKAILLNDYGTEVSTEEPIEATPEKKTRKKRVKK